MAEHSELFLADDFFVDEHDPGVELIVTLSGRTVPLMVKRGLSFADIAAAKQQATKMRFKPDGTPEVYAFDETIMNVEILFRALKSWPFTQRNGKSLPLTRENIKALRAENIEPIIKALGIIVERRGQATDPFGSHSGDPS